jgi:hypothetical protein
LLMALSSGKNIKMCSSSSFCAFVFQNLQILKCAVRQGVKKQVGGVPRHCCRRIKWECDASWSHWFTHWFIQNAKWVAWSPRPQHTCQKPQAHKSTHSTHVCLSLSLSHKNVGVVVIS